MKKWILILVLVMACGVAQAATVLDGWFNEIEEAIEVAPIEVKVGQIWQSLFCGTKYEVLEIGEKYVVYCYAEGSYRDPDVKTIEKFRTDNKLAKDVEESDINGSLYFDDGTICISDITFTSPPQKPYLYKNPNNDHWLCSKHGDLSPNLQGIAIYVFQDTASISFFGGDTYCMKCVGEVTDKILGQYIIGYQNSKEEKGN